MRILDAGCTKAQVVAYIGLTAMMLISLTLLLTVCGAIFMSLDPGGKPILGLYASAPIIQFLCLVTYIAVTFDLSDFYDTDRITDGIGNVAGAVAGIFGGAQAAAITNGIVDGVGKAAANDPD